MTKSVLVTGGAGFIGSALVRSLVDQGGWQLCNLDRLGYAASPQAIAGLDQRPGYRFVKMDIRERDAVARVLEEQRPSVVFHLAAETHVDRSLDDPAPFVAHNVEGTFQLLEAVRGYWGGLPASDRAGFRFVHVSTDEVFGSLGSEGAFTTESPYDPSSPYSASKAAADHLVMAWHRSYGLPALVCHPTNTYGPFQFPEKLIPLMIIKALRGDPLPVYGEGLNRRSWLFVEDHVEALRAAGARGEPGGRYLIGPAQDHSNLEVVEMLCDLLDRQAEDLPKHPSRELITFVADRPGHDWRYAVDTEATQAALGWRARHDLASGLEKTLRWYLENRGWWQDILERRYRGERLGQPARPAQGGGTPGRDGGRG
jgi:dTDP-glucose 4,6-dehydratase